MPTITREERELRIRCLEGRTVSEAAAEYERMSGRAIKSNTLGMWATYHNVRAMRSKPPEWTTGQIKTLMEHYPSGGIKAAQRAILKQHGIMRTASAVGDMAFSLGVRRERSC